MIVAAAPVVRSYVEHRPEPPWKVWYIAPHFRYERPEEGRYRQHWQIGAGALGVDDPDIDVEVIALANGFYRDLGLSRYRLVVNTMGTPADRQAYMHLLRDYLLAHGAELGPEFRALAEQHPLRVLDARDEEWEDVIERARSAPGDRQ